MPSDFLTLQKPCSLEGGGTHFCSLERSDFGLQTLSEVLSKQQEENAAVTGQGVFRLSSSIPPKTPQSPVAGGCASSEARLSPLGQYKEAIPAGHHQD